MGITKAIIRILLEAIQDFMECHRDFERANMELSINPIRSATIFAGLGPKLTGTLWNSSRSQLPNFRNSGLNRTWGKIDLIHQSKKSDPQDLCFTEPEKKNL